MGASTAPALASSGVSGSSGGSVCSVLASDLSQSVERSLESYEYVCAPDSVTIVDSDTGKQYDYGSDDLTASQSEVLDRALAQSPSACSLTGKPSRKIANERRVDVDSCIFYGQKNHPVNGSWDRSIRVEWTVYPGWPSTESSLRTISSQAGVGAVTLWGSMTLQRQHGVAPPTDVVSAVVESRTGSPASGYMFTGNPPERRAVRCSRRRP